MRIKITCLAVPVLMCLAAFGSAGQSSDTAKRRAELDSLLKRLPDSEFFNDYLKKSGDLPPDFDALPSQFYLPDPLVWTKDGKEQRVTRAEWPERRKQLAALTEHWLLGTAPPAPGNVQAEILEKTQARGHEVWKVQLRFGPNHAAKLSVTLYLPKDQTRPSPIFVCDSERYVAWAEGAMAEGFGVAIHGARDPGEGGARNVDESFAYADLFGNYDWSSFRRRGWSASRVVDWLVTLPFVDKQHIFIGGHSRSAKQATAGAVFDDRIAGLIASSPGSGGSMPYRYCDQSYFGESAELLTRRFPDWVHPRVRMFSGREDKLPADSHFLYALMAPRPVFMSTATEDSVEGTWTIEQVYKVIHPVYELLGVPGNLAFRYRPGLHSTDAPTAVAFSQFLLAAARGNKPVGELFPFTPYHVWDYRAWTQKNPPASIKSFPKTRIDDPTLDPKGKRMGANEWRIRRAQIFKQVEWLLGEGPAYKSLPPKIGEGEPEVLAKNLARTGIRAAKTTPLHFGDHIPGYIYAPEGEGRRPCVIWLAPFQTSRGFIASGYRNAEPSPAALVGAGFVTLGFDPIGTGARQAERRDFYEKYPHWSLMGKMVQDARHALDAVLQSPQVDPDRIYLYGYAMGGMVATLTAALDERVAGIVTVAGFTPMRTDTAGKRTSGLRRLSLFYGWLPRLGAFIGNEERIPVDFDEVLASIAPRPILIIAPTLDRYATPADIDRAVKRARSAYQLLGAADGIELQTPEDENRLTDPMQANAISWLKARSTR